MKKKIVITFFLLIGLLVFAQISVDVFDPFYDDLTVWENAGLINDPPSIRPFPIQEIKRILSIVMENGDEQQQRTARYHYERISKKIFHFGGKAELGLKVPSKQREFLIAPFVDINYQMAKYLSIAANFNAYLTNVLPADSPQPMFQYSKHDISEDGVKVGPFYALPVLNSSVAIGSPEYYFTAGIARTDFGPFYGSNILVGSQALHQGQFVFVVNKEKWTYNQALLTLTATDDGGINNRSPGKFLAIHSLTVRPLPWLSFGIVDSIIYGGRFEPIYLVPFSVYFVGQGLYDFPDNSLIGVTFTIKPLKGMRLDGALYADDMGFNEIVKFKKDAKARMAGQFGISYTMPKTHWFTSVDFNYTFVLPYTYTHVDNFLFTAQNRQNYTHDGRPLGSNLQPNSDRFNLKLKFTPLEGLTVNLFNTFIRHANISESIDDPVLLKDYLSKKYTTDGSVFNHATITTPDDSGGTRNKEHAFLFSTPFLRQQTIQYVNQLGLDVGFHFPILKTGGNMQFKIGYVFEANINSGINKNIYSKIDALWVDKDFDSLTDAEKQAVREEAGRQLAEWRKNALGKEFKHYFTIAVRIAY